MKGHHLLMGLLFAIGAAIPAPIQAAVYNFQIIAAQGDAIDGLNINTFTNGGLPALNDVGQVAYVANMSSGQTNRVLVRYHNGVSSIIARQNTSFMGTPLTNITNGPSINNAGQIAFLGQVAAGSAIFSTVAGKIVDVDGSIGGEAVTSFHPISGVPDINNSGDVAYTAFLASGSYAVRNTTALFGPGDSLTDLTSVLFLHGSPTTINDHGTVATEARIINGEIAGIISQDEDLARTGLVYAGKTWSGVFVGSTRPVINNEDQIIWTGTSSGSHLFSNFGFRVGFNEVVDGKTISAPTSHDLSDNGNVAFTASFTIGGSGLFFNYDNIISTGDLIEGHTLASVSGASLNEFGQIAFLASLDGGATQAVVLATPVPEPVLSPLLAVVLFSMRIGRTRKH